VNSRIRVIDADKGKGRQRRSRGECVSKSEEVDLEGVSLPRFFTKTLGDPPK
jgi:hypothetical protein